MTATARGQILLDVLAGKEIAVKERRVKDLCKDLADMTPRRYCRANRMANGLFLVALVGKP